MSNNSYAGLVQLGKKIRGDIFICMTKVGQKQNRK